VARKIRRLWRRMKYLLSIALIGGFVTAGDLDFSFLQARSGHEVYERFCISCHNYDGRGADRETNLFADRRRLRTADSELLSSILDGKGEMPAYSNVLTYEEAQNVLQYIRESLKRR
jgi:mono/diheme cytochrome c family protein